MESVSERHLEVVRTARYWVAGGREGRASELWVVLHGYAQLARGFLRRFQPLASDRRAFVAPEGLSRFYVEASAGRHGPSSRVGATWMTREDRENEIHDYVRYLDGVAAQARGDVGRDAGLTVLGFSQGVATASRWVTLGRVRPLRLVLWGDFLPPDLDLSAMAAACRDTEVVLVRGGSDRALDDAALAAEEQRRLAGSGLRVRRVDYPGGHEIDRDVLARLVEGGGQPDSRGVTRTDR